MKSITTFLTLFFCAFQMWATHFMGAEISYTCLGGCTYRITLTQYTDCGASASGPIGLLSFLPITSCMPASPTPLGGGGWTLVSDIEVTPLAPSILASYGSNCSSSPGALIQGTAQQIYTTDYDFCATTCPVRISFESCCRNLAVINIANPNGTSFQTHADMWDPQICNSSPTWLDPGYLMVEPAWRKRASMAAFDSEGDSLVYRLDMPTSSPGIPVTYNPGYSLEILFGQTMLPNDSLSITPSTGDLILPQQPINYGDYVFGVAVDEYRDHVLIGTYRRDIIASYTPINTGVLPQPYVEAFGGTAPPLEGGTYIDSFVVQMNLGDTLELPIQALGSVANMPLKISWSENLAGAIFSDYTTGQVTDTVSGLPAIAQLKWAPSNSGRYAFNVKLEDTVETTLSLADYSFVISVRSCDLTAEIVLDSSQICVGIADTLTSVVSGGSGPYLYQWNTGESTPTIVITTPGTYTLTVEDSLGCQAHDTLVYDSYCVWPGDADDDGVADNNDLLAIGLTYGSTGPVRSGASLSWQAQSAEGWGNSLPSGVNGVFSDTDGNGIVNDDDTLAISQNYGLTHNKFEGAEGEDGDPLLYLLPLNDSVGVGDTLMVGIMLGVDTLPADSIYGLAFTIEYDQSLVDSGTADVQYTGWLGAYGSNLLGMQKDHYSDGSIDIALTRLDQTNQDGFGQIALMSIVMIDDILGKQDIEDILHMTLTHIRVIRVDGTEVAVQNQGAEVVVIQPQPTSVWEDQTISFHLYPQPAQNMVHIHLGSPDIWDISLHTTNGQEVLHIRTSYTQEFDLPLQPLSAGLYLIRVRNEKGQEAIRKLAIHD